MRELLYKGELLYKIREALGFNQYYPLSHLDSGAKRMRQALLACAPIAFAAIDIASLFSSEIDEQPIVITIRTTLGCVRKARNALFVANIQREDA
jgi:hypothetical protein